MSYSFTEKKRIRKSFAKREKVLEIPYLLAMQLESYKDFLQREVKVEDRILFFRYRVIQVTPSLIMLATILETKFLTLKNVNNVD